jgi:hypothetical protein
MVLYGIIHGPCSISGLFLGPRIPKRKEDDFVFLDKNKLLI